MQKHNEQDAEKDAAEIPLLVHKIAQAVRTVNTGNVFRFVCFQNRIKSLEDIGNLLG